MGLSEKEKKKKKTHKVVHFSYALASYIKGMGLSEKRKEEEKNIKLYIFHMPPYVHID